MDDAERRQLKVDLAKAYANGDAAAVKKLEGQLDSGYETAAEQPAAEVRDLVATEPAADTGLYDDFSKDDLVAELERRQLPVSGNKDVLIARLEEDDKV